MLTEFDSKDSEAMKHRFPPTFASVFLMNLRRINIWWVFGQTFDEHKDKYFSLHDRRQTEMILR